MRTERALRIHLLEHWARKHEPVRVSPHEQRLATEKHQWLASQNRSISQFPHEMWAYSELIREPLFFFLEAQHHTTGSNMNDQLKEFDEHSSLNGLIKDWSGNCKISRRYIFLLFFLRLREIWARGASFSFTKLMRPPALTKQIKPERGSSSDDVVLCTSSQTQLSTHENVN